tara:strand:- start:2135 stop:2338 length:204 start_codon:yes stop_codon:yes gene_type:complete
MGNNIELSVGSEVEGWVILKEGDEGFDKEINDNNPYYYNVKHSHIWRRNLMGWGPPLTSPKHNSFKN